MRISKITSSAILLCFVWNSARALTLEECLDKSLHNSSLLKATESQIKSSFYAYKKDKSGLWPQLSLNGTASYKKYGSSADLPNGTEKSLNAEMSLDLQKLLSGYPNLSRIEMEKSGLLQLISKKEITREVTQNYNKLYLLIGKKVDGLNAQIYFDENIRDIEKLQSAGVDVKLDLTRARIQRKSLAMALKSLESDVGNALLTLNSLMNASYHEEDFAAMDAPHFIPTNQRSEAFDNSGADISGVYENQLDTLGARSSSETYRQYRFYYTPTLRLGWDWNFNPIDPATEEQRAYVALGLNFFDFGQRANNLKQLEYASDYQNNLFRENQRKLKIQIAQLLNDTKTLQSAYKDSLDILEDAKLSIQIAKSYYQKGKIKETDLLNTFTDYLTAKSQSYEILNNYLDKQAELDYFLKD